MVEIDLCSDDDEECTPPSSSSSSSNNTKRVSPSHISDKKILKKQKVNADSSVASEKNDLDDTNEKIVKPEIKRTKKVPVEKDNAKIENENNNEDDEEDVNKIPNEKKKRATKLKNAKEPKVNLVNERKGNKFQVSMIIDRKLMNIVNDNISMQEIFTAKTINYMETDVVSTVPGLTRWTKRAVKHGGYGNINHEFSEVMYFSVVLFDTAEYITLARQSVDNLNFQALGDKVDDMYSRIRSESPEITSWTVVLMGVEKEINKQLTVERIHLAEVSNIVAILDAAQIYLMMEKELTVFKYENLAEVGEYLTIVSTLLNESLVKLPITELDLVKKKTVKPTEEDKNGLSERQVAIAGQQRSWINMLSTVPRMSLGKAKYLATTYSCPKKLMSFYHDKSHSTEHKINALQGLFGEKKKQPLLSRSLYEIMTSTNAATVLKEDQ